MAAQHWHAGIGEARACSPRLCRTLYFIWP